MYMQNNMIRRKHHINFTRKQTETRFQRKPSMFMSSSPNGSLTYICFCILFLHIVYTCCFHCFVFFVSVVFKNVLVKFETLVVVMDWSPLWYFLGFVFTWWYIDLCWPSSSLRKIGIPYLHVCNLENTIHVITPVSITYLYRSALNT